MSKSCRADWGAEAVFFPPRVPGARQWSSRTDFGQVGQLVQFGRLPIPSKRPRGRDETSLMAKEPFFFWRAGEFALTVGQSDQS